MNFSVILERKDSVTYKFEDGQFVPSDADEWEPSLIYGEILNIVDEAGMGLGNADRLGYPLSDPRTAEINGLTYYYQDFSEGTIYSIENAPQLTRFVKDKSFAEIIEEKEEIKPNNPSFDKSRVGWFMKFIADLLWNLFKIEL